MNDRDTNRASAEVSADETRPRDGRQPPEQMLPEPFTARGESTLQTEGERRRILEEFNATDRAYPKNLCLHDLIERQAARTPDAVAVRDDDVSLSYAALEERANELARYLRSLGVGPDSLVAVVAERSARLVVALLGVLKAGGAYVALDPSYPAERLSFMLADSGARVLLTERALAGKVEARGVRVVELDALREERAATPSAPLPSGVSALNLAYVIYTSGSTGRPKGVMNTHAGICNRLLWMQEVYRLTAVDAVLQKTPFSFDVSVWELFWPLLAGACLVIARPGGHRDSAYLALAINEREITTVHFVPSMLRLFLEELGSDYEGPLRRVICSGEALSFDLQERFFELLKTAELHNLYGPTEASVDVTYWRCLRNSSEARVPIGRPIANMRVYITDARGEPVGVGVPGELCIGGVGVGRGYLGRPALTAERFVPDGLAGRPGERLYRTGDLARWLPDGDIEYLGRIDYQVKIRGSRVELGEIESALRRHWWVRDAVVAAWEGQNDDKRLVAYVVGENGPEVAEPTVSESELRRHLQRQLPDYMVPAAFVLLDELPLMPNGKVDRKALRPPPQSRLELSLSGEAVAPRATTEITLARVWAEALGLDAVGATDNFFALGGHSLLALVIISKIRAELKVDVTWQSFFANPTVEALSAFVEAHAREGSGPPPVPFRRGAPGQPAPLSAAQHRMWLFHQAEPDNPVNNLTTGLRFRNAPDHSALLKALRAVVKRQHSLRTNFMIRGGEPIQVAKPSFEVELPVRDLSSRPAGRRRGRELVESENRRLFDLSEDLLLRALLLKFNEDDFELILTTHHIVSDGWSLNLLVNEVGTLYEAFARGAELQLPAPEFQYADFARQQREWLAGAAGRRELEFWLRRLHAAPAGLSLPALRPRPEQSIFTRVYLGERVPFEVSEDVVSGLRALARQEEVSLYVLMLTAFKALLFHYSEQTDIVVGTTIAGRTHSGFENVIGLFANPIAFRSRLSGRLPFLALLHQVKATALEAYEHQDFPFHLLLSALHPEGEPKYLLPPPYRVKFMMETDPRGRFEGLNSEINYSDGAKEIQVKLDLVMFVREAAGGLRGVVDYNREILAGSFVEGLLRHFLSLLRSLPTGHSKSTDSLLSETARA